MFTTSVANIGPNEEIVVALEYEETLRYDDGSFRLRFPLAITPRYIPGAPVEAAAAARAGRRRRSRCWTPTASRHPSRTRATGYVNPVTIAIDLNAGFPLVASSRARTTRWTSRSARATAIA